MAKYVLLSRFTQQGAQSIKDGPARLEAAKQVFQGLGVETQDFYLTLGEYDAIVVVEAPDDEAIAKASLAIGALGNVRFSTLRAFTENEYKQLIGALLQ